MRATCCAEPRIGPEAPLAVESLLFEDFLPVDGNAIPVNREILPVALVAHQRLGIAPDLLLQGFEDGLAAGGILAGLTLIEADDVAALPDPDLLDFQRGGLFGEDSLRVHFPVDPATKKWNQS